MKKIFVLLFAFVVFPACSQDKPYNTKKGIAIEGYDPVAYFENSPARGKKEMSYSHDKVTYLFSSEAHLKMFKQAPEKYIPQYGGWCAYAMGVDGSKVDINPETYKIVDGKLYLFYNKFLTNTLIDWNKDEEKLKKQADQYWAEIEP